MSKLMHFPNMKDVPQEVWAKAVPIVLAEIRAEKRIPNWEPKLLNGSYEFEARLLSYVRKRGWYALD